MLLVLSILLVGLFCFAYMKIDEFMPEESMKVISSEKYVKVLNIFSKFTLAVILSYVGYSLVFFNDIIKLMRIDRKGEDS
ncbi:MAG: hypothetical protein LBV12_08290 [Puniceicoccales bacterium]|nr:hypothetical protein [Puniceicoccales bacterium]